MDLVEQGERALLRRLRGKAALQPQAVGQLGGDAPAGIERRHRVLGDQGDVGADHGAPFPRRRAQKIAPGEGDVAGGDADRARQDAQHRLGDGRLAGAAFADEAAHLARGEAQRHVAQDRRAAFAVGDGGKPGDGEKGAHRRITGSSARRSPSPSWLKASTVRTRAASGAASTHHA